MDKDRFLETNVLYADNEKIEIPLKYTFTIDGMQMPFRCDYKTDGNYWKAVYKWNKKIKETENGRELQ